MDFSDSIDAIVKKNLELMVGDANKNGTMMNCLFEEVYGGNDGFLYGCANYHFDLLTGEIKYFGNYNIPPDDTSGKFSNSGFVVTISEKVSIDPELCVLPIDISNRAKEVIELTIKRYNEEMVA